MEAGHSQVVAVLQIISTIFFGGMAYQMLRELNRRVGVLERWKDKADPQLNRIIGAREVGGD